MQHLRSRNSATWYRVRNLSATEAEVFIYDFIGGDIFGGGVTANDFVQELRGINTAKLKLRINSPGGDLFDAITIRNALIEHPASIETHIDGLAASAAAWVGLAADKVVIAPHAMMMIHEPYNLVIGDSEVMAKQSEILNKFGEEIAGMLAEKGGGKPDAWRDLMRVETWYTDQEAVDAGLADEVGGEAAAQNKWQAIFNKGDAPAPAPVIDESLRGKLQVARDKAERVMQRTSAA